MRWQFSRERLIALRESKGYTQEEFGERLGAQRQQIHQWERGEHIPTTSTLIRIANSFDVVPAYFFVQEPIPHEEPAAQS